MPVIGYATMPIIPSMEGVSANISKMLTGPLQSAGRQAGQAAGKAAADGARAQAAAIEAETEKFEAAKDRQVKANKAAEVAELRLQELKDRGGAKASQLVYAEGKLDDARRTAARNTRAAEKAEKDLKSAQDGTADSSDKASGALSRLSSAVESVSGKAGAGAKDLAKVGIAAAGIGSAMGLASQAIDNAALNDKLAAQLGATPAMAKEFGDTAAQLYAGAWGDSLEDVNTALKNVWQQGLVGADASQAQIKATTATVLDLAKAFDVDVTGATAAVGTMLKNGLAPDAQSAMDILTRGFQTGADKGEDLLDTMVEYPTLFRALGISGQEAMGLISQAMAKGARNSDQVADALKEFQLRAIDGSDTTANAYKTLGLDAQQMTTAMAAGGQSASQGLDIVLDRLRGMTDPVQRNAAAVGLFGTKAEDLAGALFAMDPTTAVAGLGEVAGAAGKMGDTLRDNSATALEEVKRSLQTGLVEALGTSAKWLQNNHDVAVGLGITLGVLGGALVTAKVAATGYAVAQGVLAAASGAGSAAIAGNTLALGAYAIASGVVRVATIAWTGVQWLLNAALDANPIGLVVIAIAALVAGIVLAWQHSETFRDIVIGAWDGIKTAALWTWDNVLKPVFGWLADAFKAAWDGAKAAGDGIAAAWQWICDKATAAKDWIVGAWNNVVDFVTGLPDRVKSAAGGLWDGIKDSFRGAINWLISAWNNFQLGFDFTIPVINKHVNFTIGTPDLPLLAGGGIAGRTDAGVLYGPGTGTSDSILGVDTTGIPTALVSNGEGVVRETAMEHGGAKVVAALNAGWVPSASFLHSMLPGYAEGTTSVGGKVTRDKFLDELRGIEGAQYVFGGWPGAGHWETDCSGAQAKAANLIAYGDTETGGRFGTGNMGDALAARGALPGLGGPDDYSVAWLIGGPAGGHTAGTVPGGTGFEMGGARGNGQLGGGAALASDSQFTEQRHFPASMFAGAAAGTNAATAPATSGTTPSTIGTTPAGTGGGDKTRLKTFEELGSDFGGIFAKGLLETFGLENSALADPNKLLGDDGSNVRTSATQQSGQTGTTGSTPAPATPAPASTGAGTGDANNAVPVDPRAGLAGSDLYGYNIADVAKSLGLGEAAAVIGTAAALVESELQMYANSNVPESLSYPHDAIGSDHDSLNYLQQRPSMGWGSIADLMDPVYPAKAFFGELQKIDWQSMDPGAAAQAVQRSAFPDRYSQRITDAQGRVKKAGLFDTGGFLPPGGLAMSLLDKPEPLLPADKWAVAEANIGAADRLVQQLGAGARPGGRGGDTYIANGYTAGDIASEWQRKQWARTGGYAGRSWR